MTDCYLAIANPATRRQVLLGFYLEDLDAVPSIRAACEDTHGYRTDIIYTSPMAPTAVYCPEAFTGPEQAVAWAHRLLDPEPLRPLEEIGGDMRTFTLAEVDAAFETVAGKED